MFFTKAAWISGIWSTDQHVRNIYITWHVHSSVLAEGNQQRSTSIKSARRLKWDLLISAICLLFFRQRLVLGRWSHLTFSGELTRHITARLLKWICFRSSVLTLIFQGAEIRSAVTEECLPNENWCITSWEAGGRRAFFFFFSAHAGLCFIPLSMVGFIHVLVPIRRMERKALFGVFHLICLISLFCPFVARQKLTNLICVLTDSSPATAFICLV